MVTLVPDEGEALEEPAFPAFPPVESPTQSGLWLFVTLPVAGLVWAVTFFLASISAPDFAAGYTGEPPTTSYMYIALGGLAVLVALIAPAWSRALLIRLATGTTTAAVVICLTAATLDLGPIAG